MLSFHRHKLLDETHGQVTLLPWLGASGAERDRAMRASQTLAIVERWRRRSRGHGRRNLVEVYSWLAIDRRAAKALTDERLGDEILHAVKARRLIALPGWVEPPRRGVRPPVPPVEVVLPKVKAPKEATDPGEEPTIRLVNLESRHFVPGKETVRISYAIDGPVEKAASVHLIVKSLAMGVVGRLRLEAPYGALGEMEWDGHLGGAHEVITLAQSPYDLSFELTSKSKRLSMSDSTRVELEVHSISIRVDHGEHLPVDERHKATVKSLADELVAEGLPGDCAGRVILDGPVFPVDPDYSEMRNGTSAEEYARLVGSGVKVPFLATVRLKSKTGKGRRSPAALRGSRLEWSFAYPTKEEFEAAVRERGATDSQVKFLLKVAAHEEKTARPKGAGTHRVLGGRRETPGAEERGSTVFWREAEGCSLESQPKEPWVVTTTCGGPRVDASDSAVYFVSGRIAGDTHRITAGLPAKGANTSGGASPAAIVHSNRVSLTNWRRVRIVGDWFVGGPQLPDFVGPKQNELVMTAIAQVFAPAAVLIELSASVTADARRHWKREYRDVAETIIEQGWPFLSDAIATDSGDGAREFAVRFRPYEDFLQALGARDAWASAHRRVRNFLSATNSVSYRHKCDVYFYSVFDRVAETFSLPENGLTVLRFTSRNGHNLEDASNSRGGFFSVVRKVSGRHRALVAQFSENAQATAHEIGHALFLQHAPGHAPGVREPGRVAPEAHDKSADCLMAYTFKPDFCGLCLLKLAGVQYTRIGNDGTVRTEDSAPAPNG